LNMGITARDRSQLDPRHEPTHASPRASLAVPARTTRPRRTAARGVDATMRRTRTRLGEHAVPPHAPASSGSQRAFARASTAFGALLGLAALALGARADEKVPITWQTKHFTSKDIPEKLGLGPRVAIEFWEPWARKAHYKMDVDNDARVLLMTPEKSSRSEAHLKVIARAESWFDALLPAPDRTPIRGLEKPAAVAKPAAAAKPPPDVIPEDPDGPPPGAVGAPGVDAAPTTTAAPMKSWGSGSSEPDTATAVVLVLDNEKDYASVIEMLGSSQAYLKEWAGDAKKSLGFVLEQPLAGAYVENASGQEEWNPDHELLNRTVQLLCLRRFGQQPNWLVQGLAWEGEMAYDGTLYCFPYRSEFVGVGEHTAWPSDLRNQFKQRAEKSPADKSPRIDELAHWARGRFDPNAAKISWGFVHFVATQNAAKFSGLLEELRQFRDADDRKMMPDGTWERIPHYEIAADRQLAILKKHLGADVMANAGNAFRKGDDAKKEEKKTSSK